MKFNENRQKGSGDMERTLNLSVNPLTLTCDLTLSLGSWVMCSANRLRGTFVGSLMKSVQLV